MDNRKSVHSFKVVKAEKLDQGYVDPFHKGNCAKANYADTASSYYGEVEGYAEESTNHQGHDQFRYPPHHQQQYSNMESEQQRHYKSNQRDSYYDHGPGQDSQYLQENNYPQSYSSPKLTPPPPFRPYTPDQQLLEVNAYSNIQAPRSVLPPSGYAFAQLLPGRTIRLTINTPRSVSFAPGQYILLTIPSIALFQSHPYTITSIDEEAEGISPLGGVDAKSSGSKIVLIIRAQKGFSKKLWKSVVKAREKNERSGTTGDLLAQGVKLRSLISAPMGSSKSTNWGDYETLVIICGGTGIVSFSFL